MEGEALVYFPREQILLASDDSPQWGFDYDCFPTFHVGSSDLPDIFRLLQDWKRSSLVTKVGFREGRSMMVHDVVIVNGSAWQCLAIGWAEVEQFE